MVEHFVGRVAELWRYPVKSMLGERRNQLPITSRGALGDRARALRETATGRISSITSVIAELPSVTAPSEPRPPRLDTAAVSC